MSPTLARDSSLCLRSDFQYNNLSRFDLVLIKNPDAEREDLKSVRRVLAFSGETVEIRKTGILINGVEILIPDVLDKALKHEDADYLGEFVYGIYEVPEGEMFVLGDNIFRSVDSTDFGSISQSSYLGKICIRAD